MAVFPLNVVIGQRWFKVTSGGDLWWCLACGYLQMALASIG